MMGTLARFLAEKQIPTPEDRYWAEVEGDIENINKVLKITQIRVKYHLKIPKGKEGGEGCLLHLSHLLPCSPERDRMYPDPGSSHNRGVIRMMVEEEINWHEW